MKLYFNVFVRSNWHLRGLRQTMQHALQYSPQLCGISSRDALQPDDQPLLYSKYAPSPTLLSTETWDDKVKY